MQSSITIKTEVEFHVPALPKHIGTSTGGQIPLENLPEEAIEQIFLQMKENALELVRSKSSNINDQSKKK